MNHLLYARVHSNHPLIKIRMILPQTIRIPRHRHEQRISSAADRRHEDLADLQADEEGKGQDDGRVGAGTVVLGLGELEVEIGEEGAEVGDEGGAHGEDGPDEAVVDERVDAAVFHHRPRVLGGGDVGFAVEGDVAEGVPVSGRRNVRLDGFEGRE